MSTVNCYHISMSLNKKMKIEEILEKWPKLGLVLMEKHRNGTSLAVKYPSSNNSKRDSGEYGIFIVRFGQTLLIFVNS